VLDFFIVIAKNLEAPVPFAQVSRSPRNLCALSVSALDFSSSESFLFSVFLASVRCAFGGELCFPVSPLQSALPQTSCNCGIQTTSQNANFFRIRTSKKQEGGATLTHGGKFRPATTSTCSTNSLHHRIGTLAPEAAIHKYGTSDYSRADAFRSC
jgi:hypothetical protein